MAAELASDPRPSPLPVRLEDLISYVSARSPEADPLRQLSTAVATSATLSEIADDLIGHFVDQARQAGASWTDVGRNLGVSKQAAQKRFVTRDADTLELPLRGRFGRFTEPARASVATARAEAIRLGHGQVSGAHLLLGLLAQPDSLASRAIFSLATPAEATREAVLAALPDPDGTARRRLRYGRDAKKALELALRESLHLGHNYIGTEHLLLGLLRDDSGPARTVLAELGVTRERVAPWLLSQLDAMRRAETEPEE